MKSDMSNRAGEMALFSAVVDAGSITGGGAAFGLTSSGASRMIRRLEDRLAVRLLIRTSRRLTLTRDGEDYYRAAKRILRDLDEVEAGLGEHVSPRGRLRVSATVAFGRHAIVPLIPTFQHYYPDVLVDLSLTDTVADLNKGEADVAIRVGPLPDSSLMARKLGESGRAIVASPAYLAQHGLPRTPEALLEHNCIGFNFRRSQTGWPFLRDGARYEVSIGGNVEVDNGDAMAQLAIAGHGIVRIGRFHVENDIQAGRLVTLLEDFDAGERETFHAVFVSGPNLPERVRAFVDFVSDPEHHRSRFLQPSRE